MSQGLQDRLATIEERVLTMVDIIGLDAFNKRVAERDAERRAAESKSHLESMAKTRAEIEQLLNDKRVVPTTKTTAKSFVFGEDPNGVPFAVRGLEKFTGIDVPSVVKAPNDAEYKVTEAYEPVEVKASIDRARKKNRKRGGRR